MRKRKYFSDEFKKQVVKEYLKRELTILDLMEKYSIKGRSPVFVIWVTQTNILYQKHQEFLFVQNF